MKLSELRKNSQHISYSSPDTHSEPMTESNHGMGFDPGTFYHEMEMDSHFVDTHQNISYSNQNLGFHSHEFYEILCCRNNCSTEYLIETDRYKLQKGDIIFVPPGIRHRPLLPEEMTIPYIRDVLWFSEDFMHLLARTTPEMIPYKWNTPFLFRTAGTVWEFICEMIHAGVLEAEAGKIGWGGIVTSNTANILIQLLRAGINQPSQTLNSEKPELMDHIITYVEDHLSERITLADIARTFYVSESTISQTFRKKIGISFYKFVTHRRLIAAKVYIESGIPLETTAERVGFSDYSSFFRAFKHEYGISPRQYRKMQSK